MKWREVDDAGLRYWQNIGTHGVYGTVTTLEDGNPVWCARVMGNCRLPNGAGPAPAGKALTIEGAKRAVEVLCEVTGTTADDISNNTIGSKAQQGGKDAR